MAANAIKRDERYGELAMLAGELREIGISSGLDAVGITDASAFLSTRKDLEDRKVMGLHGGMHFTYGHPERSTDPGMVLKGARSMVVGARSYGRSLALQRGNETEQGEQSEGCRRGCENDQPVGPLGRVARYSWQDQYTPLRASLEAMSATLEEHGFKSLVLVDDNRMVDKAAAHRAGLGWFGKNTLMLLPGRGSWFVIGSVLTDACLAPAERPQPDGCGSCNRCMSACPTGALVAPGVLDARRCLAWLLEAPGSFPTEHRVALGDRIYGCDICQEVCPVNVRSDRRSPPPPPGPDDEQVVDLAWVLQASDEDLVSRFSRWYIPRRQARYVRRNALVALGNSADGDSPAVERVLQLALRDTDPLVREHAQWAAKRLGRLDLLGDVGEDDAQFGVGFIGDAEAMAKVEPVASGTQTTRSSTAAVSHGVR